MYLKTSWLVSLVLVCGAKASPAADFDYFVTGNPADVQPAHTEGALLLMGGGGLVDDSFRWFLQKAGNGDIVVLKASDGTADVVDTFGTYLHSEIGGCDSVEVISFSNRNAASDQKMLEAIRNAEGIFIGGGKQYLYTDYWKGTLVGEALDAHVLAGRPLGGSSAGLAVLGQIIYTAHVTAKLSSETAMNDPFDRSLTFENDFLHLDLMRGVITDTHFSPRRRLGRLITFVARTADEYKVERMLGIGVDEKTALCVEADGSARVITNASEGRAWFVMPQATVDVLSDGKPLTFRDVKVVAAGPDSAVDLLKRTINKPAAESKVSIVSGKLSSQEG